MEYAAKLSAEVVRSPGCSSSFRTRRGRVAPVRGNEGSQLDTRAQDLTTVFNVSFLNNRVSNWWRAIGLH